MKIIFGRALNKPYLINFDSHKKKVQKIEAKLIFWSTQMFVLLIFATVG